MDTLVEANAEQNAGMLTSSRVAKESDLDFMNSLAGLPVNMRFKMRGFQSKTFEDFPVQDIVVVFSQAEEDTPLLQIVQSPISFLMVSSFHQLIVGETSFELPLKLVATMTGGILGKLTAASASEFGSVVVYDGQEQMLSVRAGPLREELVAISKLLGKNVDVTVGSAMKKKADEVEGKASSNTYYVDDLDGVKFLDNNKLEIKDKMRKTTFIRRLISQSGCDVLLVDNRLDGSRLAALKGFSMSSGQNIVVNGIADAFPRVKVWSTVRHSPILSEKGLIEQLLEGKYRNFDLEPSDASAGSITLQTFTSFNLHSTVASNQQSTREGREALASALSGFIAVIEGVTGQDLSTSYIGIVSRQLAYDVQRFGKMHDLYIRHVLENALFAWVTSVATNKKEMEKLYVDPDPANAEETKQGQWVKVLDSMVKIAFDSAETRPHYDHISSVARRHLLEDGTTSVQQKDAVGKVWKRAAPGEKHAVVDTEEEDETPPEEKRPKLPKLCMAHLAGLFEVVDDSGSVVQCPYGAECKFRHVTGKEKAGTKVELLRIVSTTYFRNESKRDALVKAISEATGLYK